MCSPKTGSALWSEVFNHSLNTRQIALEGFFFSHFSLGLTKCLLFVFGL